MLVEDDAAVRSALTRALNRTGVFAVTPVENGERALEVVGAQPVDAILTDLQMPVMDGLTLLGNLLERGVNVPVAVMTGQHLSAEAHARLRQYGIVASFTKPIEIAVLTDELQRALSPTTVGRLTGVTIFGFLQLLEVEKKTVQIVVQSGGEEGRLYFEGGALVHGETRLIRGVGAVYDIIGWPDPHLEIFYERAAREHTIQEPLQHVLMEGARLLDESGRAGAEPAHTPAPSAGPIPLTAPAMQGVLNDLAAIEGVIAVAVVDSVSGKTLGAVGAERVPGFELLCSGAAELVAATESAQSGAGASAQLDDVLISLGTQYHVARLLSSHPGLLLYVVLDRKRAILAMARHRIAAVARRPHPPTPSPSGRGGTTG